MRMTELHHGPIWNNDKDKKFLLRPQIEVIHEDVDMFLKTVFGSDKYTTIRSSLVQPPTATTLRAVQEPECRDRFVQMLLYECTRQMPSATFSAKWHEEMRDVLIVIGDNRAKCPPQCSQIISVDTLCAQSVLRGADVYATGIIGCTSGLTEGDVVRVALVSGDARLRGVVLDNVDDDAIFAWGTARQARSRIFGKNAEGVAVVIQGYLGQHESLAHPKLHGLMNDKVFAQNWPAMLVAHNIGPLAAGDRVLDMCAAPGGKIMHVAQLWYSVEGVDLTACERSRNRMEKLKNNLEKFGLQNKVHVVCGDVNRLSAPDDKAGIQPDRLLFSSGSFDRIILDPPCSGLGLRPRQSIDVTLKELESKASYQKKLMSTAATLLRPGGTLLYSTCTINPMENEEVVAFALTQGLALVPCDSHLGAIAMNYGGLKKSQRRLCQRFDPDVFDAPGFFLAKLTKILD